MHKHNTSNSIAMRYWNMEDQWHYYQLDKTLEAFIQKFYALLHRSAYSLIRQAMYM